MAGQTHSEASSRGAGCVSIICRNSTSLSTKTGLQEVYIRLGTPACSPSVSHHTNILTLASRLALASLFFSHTPTCTKGQGIPAVRDGDWQSAAAARTRPQHNSTTSQPPLPALNLTCCSVASPAACTLVVSSVVGLELPEPKCCSSRLICTWLGFQRGLQRSGVSLAQQPPGCVPGRCAQSSSRLPAWQLGHAALEANAPPR